MPAERIDEIELVLRRASMDGPVDSRQRIIGLALELVLAWRRSKELLDGARELGERRIRETLQMGVLLREAMALLQSADTMTAEWLHQRDRVVRAWKGQE